MLVCVCDLVGRPESELDPLHNVEFSEDMFLHGAMPKKEFILVQLKKLRAGV